MSKNRVAAKTTIHELNLAIEHQMRGQAREAEAICGKILRSQPHNADAYHLLGICAYETQRYRDAAEFARKAIALNGANPGYFCTLGLAYFGLKEYDKAIDTIRRSVKMYPRFSEAHNNLGNVYREVGRFPDAIASYERALAENPDSMETLYNLGMAYHELGRVEQAIGYYTRALRLRPDSFQTHNNLGAAYQDLRRFDDATAHYQRALMLNPNYPEAYRNLGTICKEQGKCEDALGFYQRALSIQESAETRIKAALLTPVIMESAARIDKWRERLKRQVEGLTEKPLRIEDPARDVDMTNFFLAYHGRDNKALVTRVASLHERACPSLLFSAPHARAASADVRGRKIRLGFMSKYLSTPNHTVAKYMEGIISNLSRDLFSIYLYHMPGAPDGMADAPGGSASKTTILTPLLDIARKQIEEDRLDILVYPEIGMDPFTYFLAFSRLAPVQCVFYGHPDTTGLKNIDYFISHEDCEVEGAEDHYSERLFKLSSRSVYTCYVRPEPKGAPGPLDGYGIKPESHIYCCPQSLFKIHPEMDGLIGAILDADPEGVFILFEGNLAHWSHLLLKRFSQSMEHLMDRIRIVPRMSYGDYLAFIGGAGVLLDTPHFSGGATTFDAIAMGTPVVTLPGRFMRSRQTYALYKRMGMMDCVAGSAEEYVGIALRLGCDPAYREKMRTGILERGRAVFEDTQCVRELEEFFQRAVYAAQG